MSASFGSTMEGQRKLRPGLSCTGPPCDLQTNPSSWQPFLFSFGNLLETISLGTSTLDSRLTLTQHPEIEAVLERKLDSVVVRVKSARKILSLTVLKFSPGHEALER